MNDVGEEHDAHDAEGAAPGGADRASAASGGVTPTGLLVIDKPVGLTSMDVCARVRSRLRRGGAPKRIKVGHGGTLDPFATGVLVVLVGKATPLCDKIMIGEKGYRAVCDLSANSTTDDPEGEKTVVEVATPPTEEMVRAAAAKLVGTIMQRPPAFSAIHVNGRRAYEMARAGEIVELPARPVQVHELTVVRYAWPEVELFIRCGKGTYIRSLARDLGASLGVGGMLTALRRTRVGRFEIGQARVLAELPDPMGQSDLLLVPDDL